MTRHRSKAERLRDRKRIADLYLHGWSQAEIGLELGIHQTTVSDDLKGLHRQWQRDAKRDTATLIQEALARLDFLERTAYGQWLKSLEAESTSTQYVTPGESGDPSLQRAVYHEGSEGHGDKRWWDAMLQIVEKRCTLLGLAAPQRHEITGKAGAALVVEFHSNVDLGAVQQKGPEE